jgi:hypothetical protein
MSLNNVKIFNGRTVRAPKHKTPKEVHTLEEQNRTARLTSEGVMTAAGTKSGRVGPCAKEGRVLHAHRIIECLPSASTSRDHADARTLVN